MCLCVITWHMSRKHSVMPCASFQFPFLRKFGLPVERMRLCNNYKYSPAGKARGSFPDSWYSLIIIIDDFFHTKFSPQRVE